MEPPSVLRRWIPYSRYRDGCEIETYKKWRKKGEREGERDSSGDSKTHAGTRTRPEKKKKSKAIDFFQDFLEGGPVLFFKIYFFTLF